MYKPYQLQADTIMKDAGYDKDSWLTREFPEDDRFRKILGKAIGWAINIFIANKPALIYKLNTFVT